jgi:hypothetical protein
MAVRLWCLAPVVVAAVGCAGGSDQATVYPVRGKVVYDGKPAAGVKVYFNPAEGPRAPGVPANPSAVTGPDGTFSLTTLTDGDGAPEGNYQVILLWPAEGEEGGDVGGPDRLLGWYEASRSKLSVTVKPGDNDVPTIQVPAVKKPPGEMKGVPGKN